MIKRLWDKLISVIDTPVWLEIFFAVLVILRIPSFFEPYYYGDEMIYLSLGQGLRYGVPFYSGLHDNKPPLLYLTAALSGNLFIFKVLLTLFSLLSVYFFWKLVKKLFEKKEKVIIASTILFGIFTTIPLFEGNIANAENFMVLPTLIAFNLILSKRDNLKSFFLAGIFMSIASLFKIVAAFDILAIVFFFLIFTNKKDFVGYIKKMVFLSVGFLTPILITFVWYFINGHFKEYLVAAFLQNLGYVSSWRAAASQDPFWIKNGPLLLRFGIMLFGFFILWLLCKKLSKPFIFTSLWLLTSLFAVTLSERPYPHYLLQSIGPSAIFFAMFFFYQTSEQVYSIVPLALFAFVPFYFHFWYYSSFNYYLNFSKFAIGKTTKEEYLNSFSKSVSENYKIADFLSKSSQKTDRVFVWGPDAPAIYSLSRRIPPIKYVADYHILDFSSKSEVLDGLKNNKPKFVIISNNSYPFLELNDFVAKNYYIVSETDTNQIWLLRQK